MPTYTFTVDSVETPPSKAGSGAVPAGSEEESPGAVPLAAEPEPIYRPRKGARGAEAARKPFQYSIPEAVVRDYMTQIGKMIPHPIEAGLEGRRIGREAAATWEESGVPASLFGIANPLAAKIAELSPEAGRDIDAARQTVVSSVMELFSGLGAVIGEPLKPLMVAVRYPFAAAKALAQHAGGDSEGAARTLENPETAMVDFQPTQTESTFANLVGDLGKEAVNAPEVVSTAFLPLARVKSPAPLVQRPLSGGFRPGGKIRPYDRQIPKPAIQRTGEAPPAAQQTLSEAIQEATAPEPKFRQRLQERAGGPKRRIGRKGSPQPAQAAPAAPQPPREKPSGPPAEDDLNAQIQAIYEKNLPYYQEVDLETGLAEQAEARRTAVGEENLKKHLSNIPEPTPKVSREELASKSFSEMVEEVVRRPVHQLPKDVGQAIQDQARHMQQEAGQGQPGGKIFREMSDVHGVRHGISDDPQVRGYSGNYPRWYRQMKRPKSVVMEALQKIIDDKGRDRGATVEYLKEIIADRATGGITDSNVANLPPEPAFSEIGKGTGEAEIEKPVEQPKRKRYSIRRKKKK